MSADQPQGDPSTGESEEPIEDGAAGGLSDRRRKVRVVLRSLMHIAIAAGLVYAGVTISNRFQDDAPEGARWRGGGPERNASFVETETVHETTEPVRVEASGTVVPARQVRLHPQVAGLVVAIADDLEPGGLVEDGELLVQIEDRDYRIAVEQAEAQRDIAEAGLRLEEANQEVARAEFELFGNRIERRSEDLMLRRPQLAQAEANLASAEAVLARAELESSRTRLRAPFDALVERRSVDVGSRVTVGTELAQLVSTARYWVEVSIPVDALRYIDVPGPGQELASRATIFHEAAWGRGRHREGVVVRKLPALEEGGRLARLLVEIEDPLAISPENEGKPALVLNAWVRVVIEGDVLEDVVTLDREHLRNGEQAWVATQDGTLDIRDLEIAFRRRDDVLVSGGLTAGEEIVTSVLQAPVQGMSVRTRSASLAESAGSGEGSGAAASQPSPPAGARSGHR